MTPVAEFDKLLAGIGQEMLVALRADMVAVNARIIAQIDLAIKELEARK